MKTIKQSSSLGPYGLYAITPDIEDSVLLYEIVDHALAGGAHWLQYRNKVADDQLRLEQARMLLPLCQQYRVPLIVNDHPEIALEIGADGVHLGQDDISVSAARTLLGSRVIGVSCYNRLDLALEAEKAGADYVAFGAFYPTRTKKNTKQATIELLAYAKRQLKIPVVAIGGICSDNANMLIAEGCDAIAVSQALFKVTDVRSAARHFSDLFSESESLNR